MTTFDDRDLFDHVEEDDHDPHPAHGRRVGVVLAVAAALVVAGVAWLLLARPQVVTAQANGMAVELLERAQQPTDAVDPAVAQEAGVDPETTRFAVRTAAGQHFAALRWDGALCLVVVPDGDQARTSCTSPKPGAVTTATAEDGSSVRLGADGAAPPPGGDWQAAGANVWVRPAPPTDPAAPAEG